MTISIETSRQKEREWEWTRAGKNFIKNFLWFRNLICVGMMMMMTMMASDEDRKVENYVWHVNSAILTDDVNEEWSCYNHPSPSAVRWCRQLIFAIIVVDVVVRFTPRWSTVCHFCFSFRFRFLSTLSMLFLLITSFYLKSLTSGISSLLFFLFFTSLKLDCFSPAFLLIDSTSLPTNLSI